MLLSALRTGMLTAVGVFAIVSAPASAQTNLAPTAVLKGDTSVGIDTFGASTASFQNWLFVGAPRELSSRGEMDGAVYIYRRQGSGSYTLKQKIPGTQTAAAAGDRFGAGVVASHGWLFVAAANNQNFPGKTDPRDDPSDGLPPFFFAGQVHVYKLQGGANGTWQHVQTLTAPEPGSFAAFGARTQSRHMGLAENADLLVVGEPNNFPNSTGRMHVFKRSGQAWSLQQSIDIASDSPAQNVFAGDSIISLPGDRFAVEVARDNRDAGNNFVSTQGDILVYDRRGAGLNPVPVQTVPGDLFAAADCDLDGGPLGGMAAGGKIFAAAQPCANGAAGNHVGRLDIYRYNQGANAQPLTLEHSIEGTIADGRLGLSLYGGEEAVSVDVQGKRILVGSTGNTIGDPNARGFDVLLYSRQRAGDWVLKARLQPTVNAIFRGFGQAVAFGHQGSGFALVGELSAAESNATAPSNGAVLVYEVPH